MSIELVILSNHLIFSCPLLLSSIFPSIRSFSMSRLFTSIAASASASVLPMNIQGWCPLGLTGLISLQSKGLSRVFSRTTIWKHQFFGTQLLAQRLKRLPPMREIRVQSLGQEDPLEKEMVTHSSILARRIPWTEKPDRLQSTGSQRVRHDWATSPSPSSQDLRST